MTKQDINNEIQKKYEDWMNEPLTDFHIPKDCVKKFEEAVFFTPPDRFKLSSAHIRDIMGQTPETLSRINAGRLFNSIMAVSPYLIYVDMDDYMKNGIVYRDLVEKWSKLTNEKQAALQREGHARMSLVRG